MNITFGIITSDLSQNYLSSVIKSIENESIPEYEILIVGGKEIAWNNSHVHYLAFDESIVPDWITMKKNLITEYAQYNVIVYMHDYICLTPGWYKGFLQFDSERCGDWDLAMCQIQTMDGGRAIDWMGLPNDPVYGNVLLPYSYRNPKGMYIPGNFWIAKRSIMQTYPLNPQFRWCEGEDIEWSKRVLGGAINAPWLRTILRIPMDAEIDETKCTDKYFMNPYSCVQYIKHKPTPEAFLKEYDHHSGDNSRPSGYRREEYLYMMKTNRYK